MTDAKLISLAWQHYRGGNMAAAGQVCQQLLNAEPQQPDALYLLGLVWYAAGRNSDATPLLQQCVRFGLDSAEWYNRGVDHLALGRFTEAAECFRQAFHLEAASGPSRVRSDPANLEPGGAAAVGKVGVAADKDKEWGQAASAFERVLAANPKHGPTWCNLGLAYMELTRLTDAVWCFRQALALQPGSAPALLNLGNVLFGQGNFLEAYNSYLPLAELWPRDARVHARLAETALNLNRGHDAVAHLKKCLDCDPNNPWTYRKLAKIFYHFDNFADALICYRRLLALRPDDKEARFLVEAMSGQSKLAKPPAEYMADLYDGRAAHYDKDPVERLGYCSPALLQEALGPAPSPPRSLAVLDLGCGTGLCGRQFRDWASTLIGVDLSPKMLAKAREKGVYDELIQGDVLVPLRTNEDKFDLILASDLLLYLGDLEPLLQAVHRALRPAGRFAFTIDVLKAKADFALSPFGHYAHSPAYLKRLTAKIGLSEVWMRPAMFPREASGVPAQEQGLVVVLSRRS